MSALGVEALQKSFGRQQVLKGVNLAVADGDFMAVLGPSGCGKTTLLRIIAGFERADAGRVAIGDIVVDDGHGQPVPPARRRIGYVAQEGGLFPHLSVAANVGFGLRRRHNRRARVAELLDFVDLGGLGNRRPDELSGPCPRTPPGPARRALCLPRCDPSRQLARRCRPLAAQHRSDCGDGDP
jgi:iron(III) transport system ATP-binding protein